MKRRPYVSGPPCRVCGLFEINVTHDDPETRARNIATWAFPTPGQDGLDYYTWAGVEYHPFTPVTTPVRRNPSPTPDYKRGYQAGYHAARRASGDIR